MPREEFLRRFRNRFFDPTYVPRADEVDALAEIAWRNYCEAHKSPRTQKAGPEFG